MKAKKYAALCLVAAGLNLSAAETVLHELNLPTGTNALISVEAGDTVYIDKITGKRGTITKCGAGTLSVRRLLNRNVSFDVKEGRVFFDRQMPRVCADAFFHVDSSRADTLELEEQNGTNFVTRWNDVRGNGLFATNCLAGPSWRTNPENRRAFISDVTQNGFPVVDFGPILYNGHPEGYGATMIWSKTCTNAYEVYEVISDTPDTSECGVYTSFLSSSLDRAGNYRGTEGDQLGNIFHDNSNNHGWTKGRVYQNGAQKSPNSAGTSGKFYAGTGFHLLGFTTREYNAEKGYTDYKARLNSFARDYDTKFGGQRLAEYLVFTNRLTSAERTALQDYLKAKWKGGALPPYIVSSLTVEPGANVDFAPGVSVKIANVAEGADLTLENGVYELNALNNPDAYFHVDADAASTLQLETQNGTNFVNRWDDALSNGVYATASTKTFGKWLPDPENRRPFISEEKLNGRSLVDFGPLQVASHTNETGYGVGYGASLTWSVRMPSGVRESFSVVRDTDDVKTLSGTGNVKVTEFGQAYLCDPTSRFGFRGKLKSGSWPTITYDNQYNNEIKNGSVYSDGERKGWESVVGAGFHLMQFILPGSADRKIRPSHFAYSYTKTNDRYVLGGTKIAEYLVFDHPLTNAVRSDIYAALRTKWFGDERIVQAFGKLTVGAGAALSLPWKDVTVTNSFAIGGSLAAASVSAASLHLTSGGAAVTGALTVEDGATVTVERLADGSFAALSAESVSLAGGGSVVFADESGVTPSVGEAPLLTGAAVAGSVDGWTVDATALKNVNVKLKMKVDGLYAVISPKATVILLR
jgi:hypothetical protein